MTVEQIDLQIKYHETLIVDQYKMIASLKIDRLRIKVKELRPSDRLKRVLVTSDRDNTLFDWLMWSLDISDYMRLRGFGWKLRQEMEDIITYVNN